MKFLLVDDSQIARNMAMRCIRQAGYETAEFVTASDGVEGLSLARTEAPNLILSDWNMGGGPGQDGIDFLKALRAEGNNTIFGFLTSEHSPEKMAEAGTAGAQFLLNKPFEASSLRAVLTQLVGAPS